MFKEINEELTKKVSNQLTNAFKEDPKKAYEVALEEIFLAAEFLKKKNLTKEFLKWREKKIKEDNGGI